MSFRSKEIYARLLDLGVTPRKSLTLQFPSSVPSALVHHFIRGYSDGDGSIFRVRHGIGWYLLGTESFLRSVGRLTPIYLEPKKRTDCNAWVIQVTGTKADTILDWLYHGATIWLPRKRSIWQP